MVDVFVHENRPLLWVERTKERMWVLGAASCTRGDEAIDSFDELHAFVLEFALYGVRSKKFRRGGGVAAYWFVVAEDEWLDKPANDVGRKGCTFGVDGAHGHLQTRGAVREHHGKGHFAPPPLALGMHSHDAPLYVFHQSGFKEIFHRGWSFCSRCSLLTSLSSETSAHFLKNGVFGTFGC